MAIDRREFLRLAAWVAAGAGASACAPIYRQLAGGAPALGAWPSEGMDFALLSRMTYGPRPEERRRAAEIGLGNWIEEQLEPATIDDSAAAWRVQSLEILKSNADELDDGDEEEILLQLQRGALLRRAYSPRQLFETLVEFWSDHFNISIHKEGCLVLKIVDDREVIRRHAMGTFRDVLWASAHSPAMLVYLDQQVSDRVAPNENYARELMELHTLSVHGGYTQKDVMELARCLTGWTIKNHFWKGQFTFNPDLHDDGKKTVLGMAIAPAGQEEGESVLERLAHDPSTAHFIATKLARRFLHDQPEEGAPEIVARAAAAFQRTGGDLKAVLRVVLLDGLARGNGVGPKFKRPADYVLSALRLMGAETDGGAVLQGYLGRMGQATFEWPTPDGPPDVAAPWSGNLVPRWQFALALARNEVEGTQVDMSQLAQAAQASDPAGLLAELSHLLLGVALPPQAADGILAAFGDKANMDDPLFAEVVTAGLLASPAFQWR